MATPNLIYVFADQLRRDCCGYNGDGRARTPNIDALADEGVDFCNAVSGHPVCAPYRASLMTGKYTSSTGMVINTIRMNPNHKCFAHVLNDSGYETAYIGKWHLWGTRRGDYYHPDYAYTPPGPYRLGFDGHWAAYNFQHNYYLAEYYTDSAEPIRVHGYEPDFQTDMAIEQIERMQDGDKPFALFLSYGTPHDPWANCNTPAEFLKSFADVEFKDRPPSYMADVDRFRDPWTDAGDDFESANENYEQIMPQYYAMTANLDWNLGRLLKAVDKAGLRDDTVIVFTSDHGYHFGEHGRGGKCIFFDESVRVPFVMRYGSKTQAGAATDVCLNTPDIMPTVLGMMGLEIPDDVEGVDLSGHALGAGGPEPEAAFMQGMGETDAWDDGFEWRAVRDKQFTYAIWRDGPVERLHDNQADPYQMNNLIDDPAHAATLERLRRIMNKRMAELGDTFESASWYHQHWIDDQECIVRTATLNND